MKRLGREDLLSMQEYEREREAFRSRIVELKRKRRISVGPLITVVFENRETLLFQVQEMIRVERIVDQAKVQDELDVYNDLLPGPNELSATLLIEITEESKMKESLDRFMGLDRGQTLAITANGEQAFAEFEGGHSHETKISAVHFVRFRPTIAMKEVFADLRKPVTISVNHGGYREDVLVPGSMREEWLSDLSPQSLKSEC